MKTNNKPPLKVGDKVTYEGVPDFIGEVLTTDRGEYTRVRVHNGQVTECLAKRLIVVDENRAADILLKVLESEHKAKLAEIEENKKQADALRRKKESAKAHKERLNKGRSELPPGFSIRYDNRRGYDEFEPYYELKLVDTEGKDVSQWTKSKDISDYEAVRAELIDYAWGLVDTARVIMSHQEVSDESSTKAS